MDNVRLSHPFRWRALLALLWVAGRSRVALLGVLVLGVGLLPTAIMLATGMLIDAVPGAVEHGLGGASGRRAVLAVTLVATGLAVLAVGGNAVHYLSRWLGFRFALEVNEILARATLGTRGVAPLEHPAVADELAAIQEADRKGVLRRAVSELCTVTAMRLRGIGASVVLLAFHWWAPLLLAGAWHLTNLVYVRTTERGVTVTMSGGAVRLRRSDYLRTFALDASAAKEIRVFGLGRWAVDEYARAWREALSAIWQSRAANRLLGAASAVALLVSHLVVLGAIGVAASRGDVSVAALFVFVQAVMATADLGLVGDSQWWLSRALGVADRVRDLRARFRSGPPAAPVAAPPSPRQPLAIRLEAVRFTYPGRSEPTLDGFTLAVPAGQALAVVGENGAGKSTLIKLVCGLYDPDRGRITLNGETPLQARRRIGAIFQDFVRYPLPLRENVGFGHLPLLEDAETLADALHDAGAGALLRELPKGWDTVLARGYNGGVDLSGGQWQRVALARALTAVRGGAGLLILDEPTANLDVRAETELFRRFLGYARGITTILVSHRLSSVRHADRIVVIHGGRVIEDGSHDELMTVGGRYAEIFALQAERFACRRMATMREGSVHA